MRVPATLPFSLMASALAAAEPSGDVFDRVQHGYADNNGVKIHYAALGEGPLVVLLHGFPEFWYSWRHQMAALSDQFTCVAMDLRGYNLSDKPKGDENYTLPHLIGDVAAVIKANGADKAIVVGHDWGGAIAWQFAFAHPEMVKRLVICNLPHPKASRASWPPTRNNRRTTRTRATSSSPARRAASARKGSRRLSARAIPKSRRATSKRSKIRLHRHARLIPCQLPARTLSARHLARCAYQCPGADVSRAKDKALGYKALNDTWEWLGKDLTLVTVPDADHWVHHDAPELVSKTMKFWLARVTD